VEFTDGNTLEVRNGNNGTSVTIKSIVESSESGAANLITFSNGQVLAVKNGINGMPGEDYILTDVDKTEIANMVIAALPVAEGGSF
jgi:hypothetical protein